eukprot:TRINITY_DN1766_c1_g1_i1.p1 TRINITY_DN1766_c1_g1~~TRINITY_DN1766_c1_g1_i1.p1  ORF type:complete len:726 (-),score=282.46 TRINITY_DN1766_c1_g1_i1:54-2231(-)
MDPRQQFLMKGKKAQTLNGFPPAKNKSFVPPEKLTKSDANLRSHALNCHNKLQDIWGVSKQENVDYGKVTVEPSEALEYCLDLAKRKYNEKYTTMERKHHVMSKEDCKNINHLIRTKIPGELAAITTEIKLEIEDPVEKNKREEEKKKLTEVNKKEAEERRAIIKAEKEERQRRYKLKQEQLALQKQQLLEQQKNNDENNNTTSDSIVDNDKVMMKRTSSKKLKKKKKSKDNVFQNEEEKKKKRRHSHSTRKGSKSEITDSKKKKKKDKKKAENKNDDGGGGSTIKSKKKKKDENSKIKKKKSKSDVPVVTNNEDINSNNTNNDNKDTAPTNNDNNDNKIEKDEETTSKGRGRNRGRNRIRAADTGFKKPIMKKGGFATFKEEPIPKVEITRKVIKMVDLDNIIIPLIDELLKDVNPPNNNNEDSNNDEQFVDDITNSSNNENNNYLESELNANQFEYYGLSLTGTRSQNEDEFVILEHMNEWMELQNKEISEPYSYIGVYDGHSGKQASEYCRSHLHWNIANDPNFKSKNLYQAINNGFIKTDETVNNIQTIFDFSCGTTALIALINKESNVMTIGNVGDCEGFIYHKNSNEFIHVAKPDKPGEESEKERVKAAGGAVLFWNKAWRVNGILACSRSIGDQNLADVVIATPTCYTIELLPQYDFMIVASDGLWDVVKPEQVKDFVEQSVNKHGNRLNVCNDIIHLAFDLETRDNVTVVIIFFHPY